MQNLRLPGQEFDGEAWWNHNGVRDYAPTLGRYLEPDPIGIAGPNKGYTGARFYSTASTLSIGGPIRFTYRTDLYSYVSNSPVNALDPFGMDTFLVNRSLGGDSAAAMGSHQPHVCCDNEPGRQCRPYLQLG